MNGIITDIHRTSVVDGPGIRTTVFLKGCPLACLWCHNPETQRPELQLGFNATKCVGCGACVEVCPQGAIRMNDDTVTVDRDRCDDCLACTTVCPSDALFVYGRSATVDEIVHEVVKDRLYYEESGGGVTVSGGEPMMQPEFTLALLAACKEAGLRTCLDTTGVGALEDYRCSLQLVDLYLFDYKATDPDRHRLLTGSSQKKVRRTLDMLLESGANVRLRCPIIPGVNDDDDHLRTIAALTKDNPSLDGVDILPWHTMGAAKYGYLGRCTAPELPSENTPADRKERYRRILADAGAVGVEVVG